MRKLSHTTIVGRQKDKLNQPRLPFCVILNNIRSLHNVGSIFRTADGVGVEKIWLCGITGYLPNRQISKTALGAEAHVPWEYCEDVVGLIKDLKRRGYQMILLEQTEESRPYQTFQAQGPVALVIGHEIEGVAENILHYCDAAIDIEMAGIKNSLNVSVAFGIVAYHFRHCLREQESRL